MRKSPFSFEGARNLHGWEEMSEETVELRGVTPSELASFFLSEGFHETMPPGIWERGSTKARIGVETMVSIGSLRIPSITVVFSGPERELGPLLARFRSCFLRAGG
ncbi:MAG TPA: hypothetical protein DIV80_00745 [Synergistaceae bacterium]|nr:hypothetical protein [Synergistaceae bacterium]